MTGDAWNKTFKPRYGSLFKFVSKHPEDFVVKNNAVYLIDEYQRQMKEKERLGKIVPKGTKAQEKRRKKKRAAIQSSSSESDSEAPDVKNTGSSNSGLGLLGLASITIFMMAAGVAAGVVLDPDLKEQFIAKVQELQ